MNRHLEAAGEISLYDLVRVLTKRKWLIIGIILAAVIASAVICTRMPKIYKGVTVLKLPSFEMITTTIDAKEIIELIGRTDSAKIAKMAPKTSSAIADIRLSPLKSSRDKLELSIEAIDKNIIPQTISEIIDYINNIDLVRTSVKEEKENLVAKANELSALLLEANELAKTYKRMQQAGNPVNIGFNPLEVSKKIADGKLDKLSTDQRIEMVQKGVVVASQLFIEPRPVKPKIAMIVILAGISGALLSFIVSFYLEYTRHEEN